MNKYKTSTFLTGLFCKFQVHNKNTRKIISELYGGLIDVILDEISEEKRILLFKSLVPIIKSTVDYFEHTKKSDLSQVDKELFQIVIQLITHCVYIIQKIGIKDDGTTQIFDSIMKQVLVDEIACDIGECIKLYKKTTKKTKKSDIVDRLIVLLTDYNVVMHTHLTPTDVLDSKENV